MNNNKNDVMNNNKNAKFVPAKRCFYIAKREKDPCRIPSLLSRQKLAATTEVRVFLFRLIH